MYKTSTGWICRGDSISSMMANAIRGHIEAPVPDAVLNIETHLFNVTLTADNCDYDIDVGKNLWLNIGRWSRLIKEYVPRGPLDRFTSQCVEIVMGKARDGATANMLFRDPDRYVKKHRWGGCLMGAVFRGSNSKKSGPSILTLYSRTTYISYMGLLDAAIAHIIWREACEKSQWFPCKFVWHLPSQQLHCFKSLPYLFSQPDLMKQLEEKWTSDDRESMSPTWWFMSRWYRKLKIGWDQWVGTADGFLMDEKYGPWRRIKRRWLEFTGVLKKHIPPSLPVSKLDFSKAI